MFDEVLSALKLPDFVIKVNNRKILSGMAEAWGFADKFGAFAIAIDKLDKIGENGVVQELGSKGFSETQIHRFQNLLRLHGNTEEKLAKLEEWIASSETGKKGIAELKEVLEYVSLAALKKAEIQLDLGLARGLEYYTSTIFEVTLKNVQMGSIASGGRYDELTASFGVPDMPGVGISFGAERIFDVLRDLNLLPANAKTQVKVLLANFGKEEEKYAFKILCRLRGEEIASEIYPGAAKLPKQFTYAEKKGIRYLLLLGSNEIASNIYPLKNLVTGEQKTLSWQELLGVLKTS
jgi:histidyl-tRNA synthetase